MRAFAIIASTAICGIMILISQVFHVQAEQWYISRPPQTIVEEGQGARCGPFNDFRACLEGTWCSKKGFCGSEPEHRDWRGNYMDPTSHNCQTRNNCLGGDVCHSQGYCAYCQDGCVDQATGEEIDMGPHSTRPAPNRTSQPLTRTAAPPPTNAATVPGLSPSRDNGPKSSASIVATTLEIVFAGFAAFLML